MADNLVYEESLNTEVDQSEFISKKWVYVNDNNSQNYTSQVVIDSTPLSNAGGWINWSEGYILMPLVVQLTSATAASLPYTAGVSSSNLGDYSWAFKNGFWNIINSMTVEFNNQNVIQQTPFLNVFCSFKSHTSWSLDDLLNEGPSAGYYPDNAGSWSYETTYPTPGTAVNTGSSNGSGIGITNNRNSSVYFTTNTSTGYIDPSTVAAGVPTILPSTGVAGVASVTTNATTATNNNVSYSGAGNPSPFFIGDYACNEGMRKRQDWYGYDPTSEANSQGQNFINDPSTCSTVYRSYKNQTQSGSIIWNVFAKLRLKDLADYFEKMPLLKGATMRFYINTNQTSINFTTTQGQIVKATGAQIISPSLTINQVTVIGGLTNPLMIASTGYGQGSSPLAPDTYNLTLSIVKNTFTQQAAYILGSSPQAACRLYAPVYTMNPLAESKYLSLAPTKKIMYKDIFQYQFSNVPKSSNFNFLVSNGINNIQSVLVVPFISTTNQVTVNAVSQNSPVSFLNACSTSPSTPDPITLSNFNILISGVNLFLNNELYDFEAFKQQLLYSNQLNGSMTTGLASGLISEDMFSRLYRYYYGDCSRVLPSEQGVSRSVQIVGYNASLVSCDIMVFVEFMKEMTIDISTGARIE
jgi:hypothetical protein